MAPLSTIFCVAVSKFTGGRNVIVPVALTGLLSSMLVAAGLFPGQTAPHAVTIPPQFAGISLALDAPNVAGGWSLLVARRGGFSAKTEIRVTSAGVVACAAQPSCPPSLSSRQLTGITGLIPKSWPSLDLSLSTVCSDCEQTLLLLQRRDESGAQGLLVAYWDVTTQRQVPAELVRLASAVGELLRANAR